MTQSDDDIAAAADDLFAAVDRFVFLLTGLTFQEPLPVVGAALDALNEAVS